MTTTNAISLTGGRTLTLMSDKPGIIGQLATNDSVYEISYTVTDLAGNPVDAGFSNDPILAQQNLQKINDYATLVLREFFKKNTETADLKGFSERTVNVIKCSKDGAETDVSSTIIQDQTLPTFGEGSKGPKLTTISDAFQIIKKIYLGIELKAYDVDEDDEAEEDLPIFDPKGAENISESNASNNGNRVEIVIEEEESPLLNALSSNGDNLDVLNSNALHLNTSNLSTVLPSMNPNASSITVPDPSSNISSNPSIQAPSIALPNSSKTLTSDSIVPSTQILPAGSSSPISRQTPPRATARVKSLADFQSLSEKSQIKLLNLLPSDQTQYTLSLDSLSQNEKKGLDAICQSLQAKWKERTKGLDIKHPIETSKEIVLTPFYNYCYKNLNPESTTTRSLKPNDAINIFRNAGLEK